MELRILNINGLLLKVSITDSKRLLLDNTGILSFHDGHLENRNGGSDPRYRVLTSSFIIRGVQNSK